MSRFPKYLVLAGLLAVAASCAKPPQVDIDAARNALELARSAGAEAYAPAAFATAVASLGKMNTELDAQNAKSTVSRRYTVVKNLADAAKRDAEKAQNAAAIAKDQLRAQIDRDLPSLTEAIAAAEKAAEEALAIKGIKLDPAQVRGELEAVRALATGAQAALASGTLNDARDKIAEARARVVAADQLVQAAVEAARTTPARRK